MTTNTIWEYLDPLYERIKWLEAENANLKRIVELLTEKVSELETAHHA
jgi:hypothetical protein